MAEIKIEKKARIWPWVLIALFVAAFLIYYFAFRNSGSNEPIAQTTGDTATLHPSEIDDYVQFIGTNDSMGLDHNFTNEALLKLTNAVQAKAEHIQLDVSTELDQVREHARSITQDRFESSHANSIRKAADLLTASLKKIQENKYSTLSKEMMEVN